MTISTYQKKVDELLQLYEKPYWDPLSQMAHLTEEVGEVAPIINALYGEKPKKPIEEKQDLGEELADVIWSVVCMANSTNIKLEPEMQKMFDKLIIRDKDRFAKKSKNLK